MPKKYRLLNDLLIGGLDKETLIKAGAEFTPVDGYYVGGRQGNSKPCIGKIFVESNPTIFEEIKEKERIEVWHLGRHDRFLGNGSDTFWYQFSASDQFSKDKYEKIKQAIEKVLNEDDCVFDAEKINDRLAQIKQLEEAFNESRKTHPIVGFKHYTFNDYLKWKNNK